MHHFTLILAKLGQPSDTILLFAITLGSLICKQREAVLGIEG